MTLIALSAHLTQLTETIMNYTKQKTKKHREKH